MGLCFGCFSVEKHMRKEEERLTYEEAYAKAAEVAQKRFYLYPFLNFPFFINSISLIFSIPAKN